jgi:hypothetical protein
MFLIEDLAEVKGSQILGLLSAQKGIFLYLPYLVSMVLNATRSDQFNLLFL